MPRPKKTPDDKLSQSIHIRFTHEQIGKLDALCERYDLSRSRALRDLVDNGEVRIRKLPETNREAVTHLRKIGGLLAALMRKFPTEAKDLRTLRLQAKRLAAHFAGEEEP